MRPSRVYQFRSAYAREDAASERDEVPGRIGRAAPIAKRDGGLRSPLSPKKEKKKYRKRKAPPKNKKYTAGKNRLQLATPR